MRLLTVLCGLWIALQSPLASAYYRWVPGSSDSGYCGFYDDATGRLIREEPDPTFCSFLDFMEADAAAISRSAIAANASDGRTGEIGNQAPNRDCEAAYSGVLEMLSRVLARSNGALAKLAPCDRGTQSWQKAFNASPWVPEPSSGVENHGACSAFIDASDSCQICCGYWGQR